jgi:hypothetical protein
MQQSQTLVHDRYELLEPIGQGGQATTYLARDSHSQTNVALKELRLHGAADWKSIELFEREAKALKGLNHRAIPSYVDAFHLDEGQRFFLVQQFIDGKGLDTRLASGATITVTGIKDFLSQVLEILIYLHSLSPPVVHRDIKPSNILIDSNDVYSLIDFGAVQLVNSDDLGGSTVVGTTGYMPPEQLMGRATPASDLYALGATAIHLLTGTHPSQLPLQRMKIQFRERLTVQDPVLHLIEQMVEPDEKKRLNSAERALELLNNPSAQQIGRRPKAGEMAAAVSAPMAQTVSQVEFRGDTLLVSVDPGTSLASTMFAGLGAAAVIGVVSFFGCFISPVIFGTLGLGAILFGAPLAAFYLPRWRHKRGELLVISPEGVEIRRGTTDFDDTEQAHEIIKIPMDDLAHYYVQESRNLRSHYRSQQVLLNIFQNSTLVFADRQGKFFHFGADISTRGQTLRVTLAETIELEWLHGLIRSHLQRILPPP